MYNIYDDLNHDVDAWIDNDGEIYAVSFYLMSEKSGFHRKKKMNKRISGIPYINFEYSLVEMPNDCVWFVDDSDIDNLIDYIKYGNKFLCS